MIPLIRVCFGGQGSEPMAFGFCGVQAQPTPSNVTACDAKEPLTPQH